jgi:hypothetical protein
VSGAWAPPGERPGERRPEPVPPTAMVPPPAPANPIGTAGGFPLRPMSVSELLDGTFATIRRNTRTVLGLAAVFVTGQQLLFAGLEALTGQLSGPVFTVRPDSDTQFRVSLTAVLSYPLSATVGILLTGVLSLVIMADIQGRRSTIRQALVAARGRLLGLLTVSVLVGVVPYLGLVALVAPGVMLWGYWALAAPVWAIEGVGVFTALRRSWRLVRTSFGRVWGVRSLAVLVGVLMQFVLVLPFGVAAAVLAQYLDVDLSQDPGLLFLALGVVGNIVAGTIVAPFNAGVLVLLYVDRRMRAEGLDIVWQRQAATRGRTAL